MSYQYLVTAHKTSAVTACVTGLFTSSRHRNLIIAKNSYLEIFLMTPEGLELVKEIGIYGRIAVMRLFRPSYEQKDLLFIVTSRYDVMILEARGDPENLEIHTKAHGNVADKTGKASENGIIAVIDPESRVIGLRLYDGLLKIIPLVKDVLELTAVSIRIEEGEIHDLNFLHGCFNPTIILLHQDPEGRHIVTHEISLNRKEFINAPWKQEFIGNDASMIIPVPAPLCGAIIIANEYIFYHNGVTSISVTHPGIKHSSIVCYAKVDCGGSCYFLGGLSGHLFMLLLEKQEENDGSFFVKDLKVELLGEVTVPECITYLDNGYLYIGSILGDSEVVKLNKHPNPETDSYVTVMETFPNLAPIVDMVFVDIERQGRGQVVTCSGGFKKGSLRVINTGVNIVEVATIELGGINGMWALNVKSESGLDNALVLSFVGHTRVLSLKEEEVEEINVAGFQSEQQTMYCGNYRADLLIQVVPSHVMLLSLETNTVCSEWKPSEGRSINVVACNNQQVVCTSGSELYYLEISADQVVEKKHVTLDHEVSCIDITPLSDNNVAEHIAIGLWTDMTCRILKIPSLEITHTEFLGGDIISRSVLFASFEGIHYLMCALGDGSMLYFNFSTLSGQLSDKKRVTLGTQPIVLKPFKSMSTTNVFACSSRPTVIHSAKHKLVFSNVNLKEVTFMCSLNTDTYPNSLALANNQRVLIGTIDEIQKLHIRSVPLGEGPKRIAHQESSQTFGVITARLDDQGPEGLESVRDCVSNRAQNTSNSSNSSINIKNVGSDQAQDPGLGLEIYNFLLLDQHTFEVLHAHQMLPTEYCLSLISCKLGDDPNHYYVVGTGLVVPGEIEPEQGRILLFHVNDGKLSFVCEREVDGACYSLALFNGKLLASINSTVHLFEWSTAKELIFESRHYNNIVAFYLRTKGDFVLVGDLMRAVTLLKYKTTERSFEEVARDYNPNWMTALEILDDETFLGAENSFNLFVCQKGSTAANDGERQLMQEVAQFHLGDFVTVLRHGSLAMQQLGESTTQTFGSVLYGTVGGAIGVITQISHELYDLLNQLQKRLASTIKSVGKIDHSFWRSFSSEVKTEPAKGFIDGDLVELFLDLPRKNMEEVVRGLTLSSTTGTKTKVTMEAIIQILEDLMRIH